MERLIMEAYKLLQKGDMEQAESLLQEGQSYVTAANPTADLAVKPSGTASMAFSVKQSCSWLPDTDLQSCHQALL